MTLYALIAIVVGMAIYAWRDWFVSLCALIVLSALTKYPDMPKQVMGIQGANPWNILLLCVLGGWLLWRGKLKTNSRGLPNFIKASAVCYIVLIVISFLRGYLDLRNIESDAFAVDYLINPLKYVIVAALVYDGARTRRNLVLALAAVTAYTLIITSLAIRWIPLGSLLEMGSNDQGESEFRRRFQKEIGFHANDAALGLVAGFWVLVSLVPLIWKRGAGWKAGWLFAVMGVLLAICLTNSRAGYLAMIGIALIFGILRWRAMLVAAPVLGVILLIAFPNVAGRLFVGFGQTSASGDKVENWDTISGGRTTNLWPPTLDEIAKSPIIGHGRLAILRTPLYYRIVELEGDCPTHPHNAYLEMLLDCGAVGLVLVMCVFMGYPVVAYRRRRKGDPLLTAVLYAGLSGACAILIMALSGQTFWPREVIDVILYLYALMLAGCFHNIPTVAGAAPVFRRRVAGMYASPYGQNPYSTPPSPGAPS
jgi:O-antigen ligase